MEIYFVIFIVLLFLLVRLGAGSMDIDRIRREIEQRGGRLVKCDWAPLGKGWFGETSDRIYEVRYLDGAGNRHLAHCKTSLFSGVYFTADTIVAHGQPTQAAGASVEAKLAEVERENQRLRAELAARGDK